MEETKMQENIHNITSLNSSDTDTNSFRNIGKSNYGKSKRIAYVVKRFPRLSETFIINEIKALIQLGMHVEVFSLYEPEPEQQQALLKQLDVNVFYLFNKTQVKQIQVTERNFAQDKETTHSMKSLIHSDNEPTPPFPGKRFSQCVTLQMQASELACLVAARGLVHMHAHFATDATTVAMLASRLSGIPYSFTAHAKDIYHTYSDPQWDQEFLKTKLCEASFSVTVSDYNRKYLQRLSGGKATIHRLYNGVDLQKLKWHQGNREPSLIVAVGRLVEKKGFTYLIDACAALQKTGVDFHCAIIGEGPDRESLESQIKRCGLEDKITMPGSMPQAEVLDWLLRATVFTLPCIVSKSGDRDGLPTVLLESMALGTPSISTRVAGITEMIDSGKSGWLVEPENSQQLAEVMQQALQLSASERKNIARSARSNVECLFDLHVNVNTLYKLFASHKHSLSKYPSTTMYKVG